MRRVGTPRSPASARRSPGKQWYRLVWWKAKEKSSTALVGLVSGIKSEGLAAGGARRGGGRGGSEPVEAAVVASGVGQRGALALHTAAIITCLTRVRGLARDPRG